jgi:hypothetical protein
MSAFLELPMTRSETRLDARPFLDERRCDCDALANGLRVMV